MDPFWKTKNIGQQLIFISAVVVFWTSAWDAIEVLVDKFLESYWILNSTNKLYMYLILMIISLIVILFHEGLSQVL